MTINPIHKTTIEQTIKDEDPTANNFAYELSSDETLGSQIWYVEWKSKKLGKDEALYYITINKNNVIHFYDDGVAAAKSIYDMIEKRRSIIQRLSEFTLVDLIAAFIAIVVTIAFVMQLTIKGSLGQEMIAIFGIILGYYFGKNIGKTSN